MTSLIALAGGAFTNASFSGSNYLFHKLSSSARSSGGRKRHLAIDSYQRDHNKWEEERQEEIDSEQKQRRAALGGIIAIAAIGRIAYYVL